VLNVFRMDRKGESDRYRAFETTNNRMLLWHGSRLTNFVGIISQGLRIAPPEAPVTGYMFGKGVYFADMVSKSANYCNTSRQNNIGCLLLCEVALGNTNDLYDADYHASNLPKGTMSTRGLGSTTPDPNRAVVLPDGCVVPLGAGVAAQGLQRVPTLRYNEFIVYDTSQVRMRYLVQCRFDYQR